MSFERAKGLADAVLMEGYALYPYRASATKNRYRWTFGVVAPRAWSEADGCEPWWLETQFLVAGTGARVAGRLRFFQIARVQRDAGPWDEGVLRTVDFPVVPGRVLFAFDGLAGELTLARTAAGDGLERVSVRIENHTRFDRPGAPRDEALVAAFASVQLLASVDGGAFVSATDPRAAACAHRGLYPALVGPPGRDDLLLASPLIMQDHAQLAPESAGDLCDATEIDEILLLRTRLLTDDEKREARATDPRAAAIVDRADALSEAALARMHGAARDVVAGEMVPAHGAPSMDVNVGVGAKVRLLAPARRTDAQDLLYAGRVATVVEIRHDVDGTTFLGVTVDGDPAAELHRWYGRCHLYRLDEVEVL
ncbi:MAG: hypothetical protein KF773_42425 [Deltaproteobacteria bacterium]|nr:hypothetical protein [Deltaproteobacteria bacterium]